MAGKKRLWIAGGIMWVLLLEIGMLWSKRPELSKISSEIAMSADMTCYVLDETEKSSVIYEVDKSGEILHFFRDNSEKGRIFCITWSEDGIWYLKQIAETEGNNPYEIYQIKGESVQYRGRLALETGDQPIEMGWDKSGMYIAAIEDENTKLSVYHWEMEGKSKVQPQQIKSLEAENGMCFTDGAYWEGEIYALTDSGIMVTAKNKEPGVTWLTGTRAGILFETYPERYLCIKGSTGTKKYQGMEQAAEADAMSQKAFWTLNSGDDCILSLTQNHEKTNVSKLHMGFLNYLHMRGWVVLATAILGAAVFLLLALAAKILTGKPPFWIKAGAAILGIQFLISIAAAGIGTTKEWGEFALLWGKKEAERLEKQISGFPELEVLKQEEHLAELRSAVQYEEKIQISSIVISTKDKGYIISAPERAYGYDIRKLLSQQTLDTIALAEDEAEAKCSTDIEGSKYAEAVIPLGNKIAADTFLVVQIEQLSAAETVWQRYSVFLWILADSILLAIVCFILFHPIRKFAEIVNRIAEGKQNKIPESRSQELDQAWHSVQVLLFQRERERHEAGQDIQSCSRFIPQYFMELMKKNHMDDVVPGEVKAVAGVFLQICLGHCTHHPEMAYGNQISRLMELFEQEREQKEAVFFPGGNCLESMRLIYEKMPEAAIQDAVNVWKRINGVSDIEKHVKPLFLLHSGSCMCGVAGTGHQVVPFAVSRELEWLERIAEQFQSNNVRMVVTEEMRSYLRAEQQCRYVGYIRRGEKKYQFYEVLEVYSEEEKQRLCRTKEKFEASMKLFYEDDFYLARLGFSEVLKECPKDRLAVWYLFACERMFHGGYSAERSHDLFAEELAGES